MIRVYRFAGDDPEALGGIAVRVIGGRVALDVGDDPSAVEALVWQTPGWDLVSVGDIDEVMPAQIPRSIEAAIDAVIGGESEPAAERRRRVATLKTARDA